MKYLSSISFLIYVVTANAFHNHLDGDWHRDGGGCGAKSPTLEQKKKVDRIVNKYHERRKLQQGMVNPSFEYDVYFHILETADGKGQLSDEDIANWMNLLNEGYSGVLMLENTDCSGNLVSGLETSIRFVLQGVSRTVNDNWFQIASTSVKQRAIAAALRQGDCSTLNVYTGRITDAAGFASLASDCDNNNNLEDGIFMDHREASDGDLFVHEAGHWLGLEHTFEGGCDSGDGVADTPPQLEVDGCNTGSDSCPGDEGLDSIENYMSYTDSCCQNTFSNGQIERVHALLEQFRPNRSMGGGSYETITPIQEISIKIPPSTRDDDSYWNASFDDYYDNDNSNATNAADDNFDDDFFDDDNFNTTNAADDNFDDGNFSATNATDDNFDDDNFSATNATDDNN